MNVRTGFGVLLFVMAFVVACDRRAESSLDDVQARLDTVVGHTMLGDFGSVSFDAPAQAEWFVVVPAGATAEHFSADSAFMKAVGKAPAGLLGLAEPSIAFVSRGKVAEIQPLHMAFTVEKVLAKPGRTTNGVKFVRRAGERRAYVVLSLD